MRLTALLAVLVACSAESTQSEPLTVTPAPPICEYTQAFGNSSHTGVACPEIRGMRVVAILPQDPDADRETFDAFPGFPGAPGFLQIHESPPLASGGFVVVPGKSGFVSALDRSPETWRVSAYHWVPNATAPGAALVPAWSTATTWQPVDSIVGSLGSYTNGYVQLFAPAIADGSVYVPSRFGRLDKYRLVGNADSSPHLLATINPFSGTPFDGDELTIVTGAVSVDKLDNVYYTVTAFPTSGGRGAAPRGSWLVRVRPDDTSTAVDWESLTVAAGATGRNDLCEYPFGTLGTHPATSSESTAPLFHCGPQRPALNAPVAISDDGSRLVMLSYANNAQRAAFLVTIDAATLTPLSAFDTRGHLLHGCSVRLPADFRGDLTGTKCSTITDHGSTHLGFDPDFNTPVAFFGEDIMDNAPTIAPNGDVAVGSYDGGFSGGGGYDARGAGVVFGRDGSLVAKNQDFFWEVTASVTRHQDGTFSYLADRNLYSDSDLTIAQYDRSMAVETEGSIGVSADANAVDWLDAHILYDVTGRHYGVNGSGVAVAFDAAGRAVDQVELTDSSGMVRSIETLSGYGARDPRHLYFSYGGSVYVIEGTGVDAPPTAATRPVLPSLASGIRAKRSVRAPTSLPPTSHGGE